jgi:tripartite-type tricarboxylate transporter receptor subunit TctC
MRHLLSTLALCTLAAIAGPTAAQTPAPGQTPAASAGTYPDRPVRIVVPLPPGGVVDTMARLLSPALQASLGQPIVIQNVSGAGGTIGAGQVAKSPPDGYTILMVYDTFAVNPALYKKLPFDSFKDLAPVMELVKIPLVMAAPAKLPANNLKELVELAKTRPNGINYSSGGAGSSGHLAAELLKSSLGIANMTHIPYKGGGPALLAAVGGEVDFTILGTLVTVPQIRSGNMKALAVLGSRRTTPLPNVPTAAEQGIAGFDASSWIGLLVPAGTPAPVTAKIHAAFAQALKAPSVVQKMAEDGNQIVASSPEQFAAFLARDAARWAKVVTDNNIQAD